MKSSHSNLRPSADDVTLASRLDALLDLNESLERQLVQAAKTVSTLWKIEVRDTGETIYRLLDTLNAKMETYLEPDRLAAPGAKPRLHRLILRGERDVSRLAVVLRSIPALEPLRDFLDAWTEAYLDLASALSQATDPEALSQEAA